MPTYSVVNGLNPGPMQHPAITLVDVNGAPWDASADIPDGTFAQALTPTAVKTSAYTAAAGDFVPVDTTSGSVTVTLPATPADRTRVAVKHVIQGGTNTVTYACGGSDVLNKTGGVTSGTLTLSAQAVLLQYKVSGAIWYVQADDMPLSQLDARFVASGGATVYRTGYASPGAGVNAVANITGSLAAVATNTEHLLQTSWLDNNVVAIRNTRTGNTFSAARFLDAATGAERGAIGYGNDTPGTYPYHGAMFVESSNTITADGTFDTTTPTIPLRFVTSGKINGTFFQYRRQEFDTVGDITFWDLGTTMATQKEFVRFKGATSRVGIGYGTATTGGNYGASNPAATFEVAGKSLFGAGLVGDSGFTNRQSAATFPVGIISASNDGSMIRMIRDTIVKVDLTIKNDGTGSVKRLEFIDTDNSSKIPLTLFLNGSRRVLQGVPNSAPVDATLATSTLSAWVDESGNLLTFRVKYADGTTVKSGAVALV